jgi:hypothetical protein
MFVKGGTSPKKTEDEWACDAVIAAKREQAVLHSHEFTNVSNVSARMMRHIQTIFRENVARL